MSTLYTLSQVVLLESLRRYGKLTIEINGDSMLPYLQPGSMVTIKNIKANDVEVGDIVVCFSMEDILVHRLIQKVVMNNNIFIVTKGDNCNIADFPVESFRLIAKVADILNLNKEDARKMIKYVVNPNLVVREEGDELLLFNKETEDIKVANEVGSAILKLCDGSNDVNEINAKIALIYPKVPQDMLCSDIEKFIDIAHSKNILTMKMEQ